MGEPSEKDGSFSVPTEQPTRHFTDAEVRRNYEYILTSTNLYPPELHSAVRSVLSEPPLNPDWSDKGRQIAALFTPYGDREYQGDLLYRRLREAFGRITDDELGTSPLDSVIGAMKIAPFLSRLFALKEKMPKKGRLYYKLLPEDVKVEVDAFVAFLKENNEYIRNLVQDYVESKTRLAMLYDTDPTHIKEQQEKAVAEADKLIANKILDVIRTMLCKDREVQSFEYTEARKAYFTEQMICEILIALEQAAMSFDMEYDDRQKAMSTELSKAARKEWYLRHKDKGVEP